MIYRTVLSEFEDFKQIVLKTSKYPRSKIDLPLFGELGQTSQDLVDIWSVTQESWDVCPNSPKSGKKQKGHSLRNLDKRPKILAFQIEYRPDLGTFVHIRRKMAKSKKATF